MALLTHKLELALNSYLRTAPAAPEGTLAASIDPAEYAAAQALILAHLPHTAIYEAHGRETMDVVPRLLTMGDSAGGALGYAGIFEVPGSFLLVGKASHEALLGELASALLLIFAMESLPAVRAALNAPSSGDDLREVIGFGLSALEFTDSAIDEGRDPEKAHFGIRVNFVAVCHEE